MALSRWCFFLVLLAFLPPGSLHSQSSEAPLVMPRELVDFAAKNGCRAIGKFFDRPGMLDPPFIYGWAEGDRENSAAFWCQRQNSNSYRLMFKVRDPKLMSGCATMIEWTNLPAGLSVEVRPNLALNAFRDATDPKLTKPTGEVKNVRVIVNYYDGLTDVFYCHRGRWLVSSTE
jgi:hypothetical protein